jgi:ketosteroid isomerase-like protein
MPFCETSDRPAISQRNIDIHARMVAAVRAREVPDELLAPDFRMEHHAAAAVDYAYSGATGWREWMSDLFEVFDEVAQYRVEEIVLAGDDFVVAMFRVVGRSVRSGNWLALCWAGVTWFHDGKATRAVGYTSRDAALKAVELHSQAKSEAAANTGSHASPKHP